MDYTELLPPLPEPVDFCVDKDSHLYDTWTAEQVRAAQLAAIAAAAPAIRRAERGRCLAEIEEGIWFDMTTAEILDSIAAAIRALPEEP